MLCLKPKSLLGAYRRIPNLLQISVDFESDDYNSPTGSWAIVFYSCLQDCEPGESGQQVKNRFQAKLKFGPLVNFAFTVQLG